MIRLVFESAGAATLFIAALFALRSRHADFSGFSQVAGFGTLYLGVDEALDLHVRLGDAMYRDLGWRPPPGINHFDDLLVMVVALAGLTAIAWYNGEVRRHRQFAVLFGIGLSLFAAAVVLDATLNPSRTLSWWTEESAEFGAGVFMVFAFRQRLRYLRATPVAGTT